MDPATAYDPDNIFAKILRGDAPCHRVWEDDDTLAFLDVFPQSRGHTLVIPKHAAARDLFAIDGDGIGRLHRAAQSVARGIVAALRPDGLQVMQFNGAAAGQTVFHIHVHLIPRWSGEAAGQHGVTPGDPAALAALAAELRAHFGQG